MLDIGRGVKLITRSEWGARAPLSKTSINPTYGTTVHWEGPHMGDFPHSACDDKVREIQRYHMDTKGWDDIAYTAVACHHGFVYEGRWIGRRTAANGTDHGNDVAYAVCWLGGEGDPFTDEGKVAIRAALDTLDAHGAGSGRNGHRDWKPTECPGDVIYQWVHAGAPAGSLEPPQEDDVTDAEHKMLADINHRTSDHSSKINSIKADVDALQAGQAAMQAQLTEILDRLG